jgi:cohesin complex subunit SCC1
MFYGQFILGKKGPLAKIWFAAHVEKKLSRSEILATDVGSAIEEVIRPKVSLQRMNINYLC